MKNFDEARRERVERDRSFQMGGETFVHKAAARPEDLLVWEAPFEAESAKDRSEEEWIKVYDETIVAMLEPGQEEKWAAVREDTTDVVTLGDMTELVRWLLSEMTGRPTGRPSDSSDGRGATGTTSTDGSSSREPAAVSAT